MVPALPSAWHGPGGGAGRAEPGRWRRILWSLVYPQRGQRIVPTLPGVLLVALSLGVGMAAYNTANNILFITLSLLLSCLILSGVLSWLNFRGVDWRVQTSPPWRVGQDQSVTLQVRNAKRVLPTYGLWFDVRSSSAPAETRRFLRERLDPLQGEASLDWIVRPARRGVEQVELLNIGSLFPFGFLRKNIGVDLRHDVVVWPAPVAYQWHGVAARQQLQPGERTTRAGLQGDLLALRKYQAGDSHRQIHWKASARLRQLMTRQFTAESQTGFSLWLETDAEVWTRPEQFEVAVSFAATLAEDLFKAGQLGSVAIDRDPPVLVRRLADVESFLDRLAVLTPGGADRAAEQARERGRRAAGAESTPTAVAAEAGRGLRARATRGGRPVLTFAPEGAREVAAYVDHEKAATT